MNRKELQEIKEILKEIKALVNEVKLNTTKEKKEEPKKELNRIIDLTQQNRLTMNEVADIIRVKYGRYISRNEIFSILREKNYVYSHGKKKNNSLTIKGERSGILEQEHQKGKYRGIYVKADKLEAFIKTILGD